MAEFEERQGSDGTCVLRVDGEVDLAVIDELLERVRGCLERASLVELDCAGLSFIDSSGLGALVRVSKEAAEQGKQVELVNVHSTTERLLQVSGLYDTLVRQEPQP